MRSAFHTDYSRKPFLLECIKKCLVRTLFCEKRFAQWSHPKGLSPEWISKCRLRWFFWEKRFPHWSHGKGFSPEWISKCLLRWLFFKKLFPQWSHSKGFSLGCVGEFGEKLLLLRVFFPECWLNVFCREKSLKPFLLVILFFWLTASEKIRIKIILKRKIYKKKSTFYKLCNKIHFLHES